MTNLKYTPGVGRLATDRYDFQKHIDGYDFNHHADGLLLSPQVNIDGYVASNLQSAIEKIADIAFPPTIPDATQTIKGILKLAGDLAGPASTADSPRVTKIQGYSILNAAPSDGNVLTWDDNNGYWTPSPPSTQVPPASDQVFGTVKIAGLANNGDIGGLADYLQVNKLQGYSLKFNEPVTSNQFLKWDGSEWTNSNLPIASANNYGVIKLGCDLGLSADCICVVGIQCKPIAPDCPSEFDALLFEGGSWRSRPIPLATSTTRGAITLTEDLSPGNSGGAKVVGLRLIPLRDQIPFNGQFLRYVEDPLDGSFWQPSDLPCADGYNKGAITLTNDLGGACDRPTVVGIYNQPISPTAEHPMNGDTLVFRSNQWDLAPVGNYFTPGNNLSGSSTLQTVVGLYDNPFSYLVRTPNEGDTLVFRSGEWSLAHFSSGATGATGAAGATGATGPGGGTTGATGATGTSGSDGVGYRGLNSPTAISLATGGLPYYRTWTTNLLDTQTSFVAGTRVRAAIGPTYMEGVITSFSGNTLTVFVDNTSSSSGTYGNISAPWTFSVAGIAGIAGTIGATGATGAGAAGANGATGATGAAGSSGIGTVFLFGASSITYNPSSTYLPPGGPYGGNNIAEKKITVPVSGTVSKLYLNQTAGTGADRVIYTVYKNGVATTLTTTTLTTATSGSDVVHSFPVNAGDNLSVIVSFIGSTSAFPTNVTLSILLS
jgi:hypothetical protein